VEYASYQLFIHSVIFIVLLLCFNLCVMIPSGHMTSIVLSILERDTPLLLFLKVSSLFSPREELFGSCS